MRIAMVCPYAWDRPGGVQSHIRDLSAALRGRGHDVLVVAPRSAPSVPPVAGVAYSGRSIPIPANGSVAPIAFGPGAWRGWSTTQRDLQPEVIHVHEPLLPSVALFATLNAAAPVVATFHASAPRSRGYAIAKPVLARVAGKLAARIAVSDAARDLVARYFPGEYDIVPNGFDPARFRAAATPEPKPERVVFLGRLERRKGLEVLLRAAALLGGDVEVVVAGSGPEEDRCRTFARRAGLSVRFLGRVSDAELPAILASAAVFCSPALGGESFGIVLLEAMAAGAPVVCSDLPGFRSAASDAARYVPPGDERALAGALSEILQGGAEADELRARGTARAELFDWARLAPDIEAIYDEALGS